MYPMKWLIFLAVALVSIDVFSPSAAFTESEKPIVIKSISHLNNSEVKETITFKLAAPVVPKIFTIGGEKPRLVIDFPQSVYLGKNVITLPDGILASDIRIGLHQTPVKKTRAVVDLSKKMPVQYTTEYLEQDNTLIVTLVPGTAVVQSNTVSDPQPQSLGALPDQDKLAVKSPGPESIAVVSSAKVEPEKPAGEKPATPVVPMLLEITFDDSSDRGETVLFRLNDFHPPTVSAIEKESPRIFCDFMAMNLGPNVQKTILAKSKYIERIRTARHQDPDKVRVILELSPGRDYDLQQIFFRKDNLFVLVVNELTPEQGDQK
jgi:hypothetical protein